MTLRKITQWALLTSLGVALMGCGGGGGGTTASPPGAGITTFMGRIVNPGGGRAVQSAPAKPARLGMVAVTTDGRSIRETIDTRGTFSFQVPTGRLFLLSFTGDADGNSTTGDDGLEEFEGAADTDGDGILEDDEPDSDGDGVTGQIDPDHDNDGVPDAQDPDSANDGTVDDGATNASTQKPAALPDLKLYSASSPFNREIEDDATAVDAGSRMYIDALAQTLTEGIVILVKQDSAPVYFAGAGTPRHNVSLVCGPAWELGVTTLKNVPIPDYAEPAHDVDGADNPVRPGMCGDEADQDNNMVIIDTTPGCEYDFWQARKVNGNWEASWANALSIAGSGVDAKELSARGSGFAFLGGVLCPGELQRGEIEHALVCNLPPGLVRGGGPVAPATGSDGETNSPSALPEGARLRLDPSLDLNTLNLTAAENAIAKAMQEYGLYVSDNGGAGSGAMGLYAIDPRSVTGNPYAVILPDEDFVSLPHIPVNRLQVLQLPAQEPDFQQRLGLPSSRCAQFL